MNSFSKRTTIGLALFMICILASIASAQSTVTGKPRIAVVGTGTSTYYQPTIRQQLGDSMVNELVASDRFTVVDRSRTEEVLREQGFGGLGFVESSTAAKTAQMLGAQYLVMINPIELRQRNAGFSRWLPRLPVIGSINLASYSATVKFNVQVVDSTSGVVVFAKEFESGSTQLGMGTYGGWVTLDGFGSKAMQVALESGVKKAASAFTEKIGSLPTHAAEVRSDTRETQSCSISPTTKAKRIMVVIPEIHIRQRVPDPAGETEIIKRLIAQGFNVVDQGQISAIKNREQILAAVNNQQAAIALAVEFRADIIIVGEAFSEFAGRAGNMVSTRARVEARAIQTDTGRILAADGKHDTGLDVAEFVSGKAALTKAGGQWADYFLWQMCSARPSASNAARAVQLMATSITWPQLGQLVDALAKSTKVRSISKTYTDGVGRIELQFDGTAEELADAISNPTFGMPRVNIVGVSGNKIELSISRRLNIQ